MRSTSCPRKASRTARQSWRAAAACAWGAAAAIGTVFALVVAAELAGEGFAQAVQLNLEYAPAPPFNSGRPETAPPEILAMVMQRMEAMMPARLAQAKLAAAMADG